MGSDIAGSEDGTLPLKIQPSDSLKPITYSLPVASAQVKSCLMFASLYAQGVTELEEKVITRDHTERMFKQFNIPVEINRLKESNLIKVKNVEYIAPQDINICGDFSSASFFILAGLITPDSEILIRCVCHTSVYRYRISFC